MLQDIRNFICYNQKQLLKYEFEIAELHKEFRVNKTNETLEKLVRIGFDQIQEIFTKNAQYVKKIYKISDIRITIKMLEEGKAIDIFRSDSNPLFQETSISENSGFDTIVNEKKDYYIEEDLESLFIIGEYKNPRLRYDCLEQLNQKAIEWKDCWRMDQNKGYYNSTLIIPMSINNKGIDKDSKFFKKFFPDGLTFNQEEKVRSIFGFFCLDSKKKHIFTNTTGKEESINYGFIFADILSLYLAFFYNHTSGSRSVNEFLKGLNK